MKASELSTSRLLKEYIDVVSCNPPYQAAGSWEEELAAEIDRRIPHTQHKDPVQKKESYISITEQALAYFQTEVAKWGSQSPPWSQQRRVAYEIAIGAIKRVGEFDKDTEVRRLREALEGAEIEISRMVSRRENP
jgi:hypothetical protein